jgi:hypothetical protein
MSKLVAPVPLLPPFHFSAFIVIAVLHSLHTKK